MNKIILQAANKKAAWLVSKCKGMNLIFLDDWRGWRFVYDCGEVKRYPGSKFLRSRLFQLLKNEKPGKFTAGLYRASRAEKRLFGPQYFLNCKTYSQYANCYINFFLKKITTTEQAAEELALLKNLKIIYCKQGVAADLERKFRSRVLMGVMSKCKNKEVAATVKNFFKDIGA